MLFKGNSTKLELLIEKIQANKENQTAEDSDLKALGTEAASSWRSETPEDQTSLSPGSSCATPNSTTDAPEAELSFTIGVTEATPYACQFCDKAFPRLSYLKKHEQTHSDQMPFKCDFCNRLFKHKRSRDRHLKLHTGDKKYRCPHCESAFSRSDHLKIHMKTHDNQKPFQCTVCNRGYNTAAALTSHMQNHKKESSTPSPGPFRCLQCTATFGTAEELQSHIQIHRDGSPAASPHKCEKVPTPSPHHQIRDLLPFPTPKLACIYCTKDSFTTMEALQLHVQAMHGPLLNGDFSEFARCHMTGSPLMSPSPGLCPSLGSLGLGLLGPGSGGSSSAGGANLPFSCDFCTMKFGSLQLLQKHTLTVHSLTSLIAKSKENVFCAQCALAFPSATAFAEHFLLFHGNNKGAQGLPPPPQLKPTDLSKKSTKSESPDSSSGGPPSKKSKSDGGAAAAARESGSASTSGTATPLLPPLPPPLGGFGQYQHPGTLLCNQCNAAFPDFESFRTHLKTHLDEVVHKYVCSECRGEFSSEEQLDSHVVTHYLATATEYGCQCCLKLFGKPDELQKHLMDIHAHHLYRCSLCKEMFDSKVSIQVHFAVKHSNECRLFKCTACSSVFRSEMEFQLHVKVAHLRKAQPFRCLLCNASFGAEMELQYHLTTHQKQFQCALCDDAFHVEFLLDKHMQSRHSGGNADQDQVSSDPENLSVTAASTSTSTSSVGSPSKSGKTRNGGAGGGGGVASTSAGASTNGAPASSGGSRKDPKCDICDRIFGSDSELASHRKQMHNIKGGGGGGSSQKSPPALSLHCAYCNENCKSRTELENHMKTHQSGTGKHKCNICDEVCPTATILAEHKLTHCKDLYNPDRYQFPGGCTAFPLMLEGCRPTRGTRKRRAATRKHQLTPEQLVISGSTCTACKQSLKSEDQFYTHLHQHGSSSTSSSNTTPGGLPLPCVVCRQTLMSEVEVRMHAKFHTKNAAEERHSQQPTYPCCVCLKQTEGQNLIQNGMPNSFVCKECFHPPVATTPEEKLLRCQDCAVKFETVAELERHLLLHKKTYTCIKCQRSFETEVEIQMHVATHLLTEGSNHECRLCRQLLDTPLKLQCHLIEHTFEGCTGFACYLCSAVFTAAAALQQHMLEHGLAARPYDCSRCRLKFFFRAELENHVLGHGDMSGVGVKCGVCSDVFPTSAEMQQHCFRTHSASELNGAGAEEEFACPGCNRRFQHKEQRKAHMKSHRACGKAFRRRRRAQNKVAGDSDGVASAVEDEEDGEAAKDNSPSPEVNGKQEREVKQEEET